MLRCEQLRPAHSGAYTFQITITKTYNVANLFEDLKALYKMAGLKGRKARSLPGHD